MKICRLIRFALLCAVASVSSTNTFVAEAATVPPGACLYALDSSAADAFQIAGAQSVYSACGVVSESSSTSAFEMEGSETLYLQNHSQVSVVGSALLNGQTKLWDTISNAQVSAVKVTSPGDPLASIAAPTSGTVVSTSPASYDMNHKPTNNTFSPGVYCGGLTVGNTNGATFTMSPGVYVMAGGGLTLNSQAIVSGAGVTVYNTSSSGWGCSGSYNYTPVTISGQVTATLSAPTSGSLNGILFFGNRTGCSTPGSCQDQINGGSTVVLNGAVYFKSDKLTITGSNASGYMMLVADKIYINGNSTFGTNGNPYDGITVSVSPATSSLNAGQTQQFTATVNDANTAVTWSISPTGAGSINSTGLYTAPATVTSPQTVTVTATSQADTSKSGSATVTLYPPVTVGVSPAAATLYGGQTQQLTATVTNTGNTAVIWSVSPAGTGTVSASGLYTAPASISSVTTVTVTATSVANTTKSASATITLEPPIVVSVSPTTATLYGGQTQQLTATVTNTSNTAVTWTASPAGTGTVSASGLYTAPASISSVTTVIVTATSVANTTKSASATIALEPPIAVSVSPTTTTLYGGQTQHLNATVTNTSNASVNWTISPVGTGTVSASGLYTAPASIGSATTVTVIATSQANTAATASATITLEPPIAVSVSPTTATLYGGQTQQLNATVTNTSNASVNWTISPAGTGTVSASGLYTAPASISSVTTVTVIATSQANTSATASATITLSPPVVVSGFTPTAVTLYAGQTQLFSASAVNTSNAALIWTISPAGLGTISSTGLYIAPASIATAQTVTVTATSQANSSATASGTVTLSPPVVVSGFTPTAVTLYAGQTQQFSASAVNTSNAAVTWTISPAGAGTISSTGLYTAPASIATAQTVTVTATSQADSSATASGTITLSPPISVTVSPTTATLYGGQTQQLAATVVNTSNTAVTWTVSPAGTGSVSSTGLYTAPASIGTVMTVTVTATSQADSSQSASAILTLSVPLCQATSFAYRRILTINHANVPNTDQTDFPVLVSGAYSFLANVANGGHVQNASGYDIIFTSDPAGQNQLDFEIDSYSSATGTAAFWVRIPTLSHLTDTPIYMWYGNSSIATSQENIAGVWRNGYLSVYHLGNGASIGLADSGIAGYSLAQSGSVLSVTGMIGGGAAFDGNPNDYLYHDSVTSYPSGATGQETLEAWEMLPPSSGLVGFGYGANSWSGSRIALDSASAGPLMEFENIGVVDSAPIGNAWHHLVGTYAGGHVSLTTVQLYLDGTPLPGNNNNTGDVNITTDELKLGGIPTVNFCCGSPGSLDEVRISSVIRSADWISAEYNNESSPSTFYALSVENAVAINPPSAFLYASQSMQFAATTGACLSAVTWTISPAGAGSIDATGLYTAPASIAAQQQITITATNQADSSESSSVTITLLPPSVVTVSPSSATIVDGSQPLQFTAMVTNASNTAVTWAISPAGAGSITGTGLYTSPESLTSQTVTVTATSQTIPQVTGSATITLSRTAVSTAPPSPVICASTGFTSQRLIVIDHTKVPNTDQANFPFLFSATDSAFATIANGGKVTSFTGDDILFSLDPNGTTKLDYELQQYNPVTGQVVAWVRIPILSHTSDTVLYLFYGNPNIGGPEANPTGVWDANYQAVYHLASIAGGTILDSTSHGNNATAKSVSPISGIAGGGVSFNGVSSYIDLPQADFNYPLPSAGVYPPYSATFQTWFKTVAGGLILEQDNGTNVPGTQYVDAVDGLDVASTGNLVENFFGTSRFGEPVTSGGVFNDNNWHLATLTAANNIETLYVDGQFSGNYNMGYPEGWGEVGWSQNYNYYLGTGSVGWYQPWSYFQGSLDEVNISTTVRSNDWIVAQFNNQGSPSTFYKLYPAYAGNVSISPPAINLYAGQSQQFAASTTGACISPAVIWSGNSSNQGSLSEGGLYRAPLSIDTQQTVTVTATTVGDSSSSVSAVVTLMPPVSVSLAPMSAILTSGQTQQLVATVANASNTAVTWTLNPAGVGSISPTGFYSAPAGVTAQQTVNITATSQADSTESASATFTLMPAAPVIPVAVTVSPASATVYPGQTQQLTATVTNSSNTAVTWQISPAGVGAISAAGLYTAPATIATQQSVTITATSQADPTQSAWAILTLSPASCASSGYAYERAIVINHAQVHNSDQTNFPVLFSTTDPLLATTANGGHVASASGYDIIFSADPNGLTKLDYELEQYNPMTGQVVAWVRVPALSHTADTTIYLFYGNANITASQQNATGVWDINYLDVLHLDETGGQTVFDSTANGNNGAKVSQSSPAPTSAGQIGGAQSFNGTSDYIVLPQPMTGGLQTFSVSFWTQTVDTASNGTYWNQDQFVGDSTPGNSSGDFGVNTNAGDLTMWSGLNSANDNALATNDLISDNTWHRIDAVNNGSIIRLYLDGNDTGQTLSSGLGLDGYGWYLGAQHFTDGGAAFYHQGSIDEFRFSNSARSSDWIATEYNNEKAPSTFYSLAPENSLGISPASIALFGSQTQQFTATGACTANVSWSIPVGSPGSLTSGGLYTAPVSIGSVQTVPVTATSQINPSNTTTATVTLLPTVSVTVSPSSLTLNESQSQRFTATVTNGATQAVVWTISPAGLGAISSTGVYSAPANIISSQTVTITATSLDDSTKSSSATVILAVTGCVSNGYGYQRTIVIDHTKVPNSDQADFPFLFNTTDSDLATIGNGGHVINANGYDIIFSTDPNGLTKLDHEIEQYNPATGQLIAWVRIPVLLHTADTVIYVFYGNPNITASQANSTSVWDTNYQAVYHLGNLTSTTAPDSTVYGNSGSLASASSTTGEIDGGASFNGSSSYVQIPSADFPNYPTGVYTNIGEPGPASTTYTSSVGVWFKTATAGGILSQVPAQSCTNYIFGFCIFDGPTEPGYYDPSGWNSMLYIDTNGKLQADGIVSAASYNDNRWHYAVMTNATDGTIILYVDGKNVGIREQDFTVGYSPGYSYFVGTAYTLLTPSGNWDWLYFNGGIDEVSVSDSVRSADWIATQFNNQSSPSTFYSFTPAGSVLLAPSTASLYASQTQQFTVAGLCSSAVTWSMASGSAGTLAPNGLYSAPANVATIQSVTITAANQSTDVTIGSAAITLLPAPNPIILTANAASPYAVGSNETFTARLQDQFGTPESGIKVIFTVTGTNANIGSATTDSSGAAAYSYSGSGAGSDRIQASAVVNGVGVTSSSLSFNWTISGGAPVQASVTLLPQPTLGKGGLVGAFTDSAGAVVQPIAIGASAKTFIVPARATQLQLGIDSVMFSNNGGSGFVVAVNGNPVTVLPTSMPWTWVAGGLNANFQYGFSDGTAPTAGATSLAEGQTVTIAYQSGTVSANGTARPFTNADGDQMDVTGTSESVGLYFPTLYTTGAAYPVGEPVMWSALVTDSSGLPVANTAVTLYVSGANPGQYAATTDSTGIASFAYTGTYPGTDTLQAQSVQGGNTLTSGMGNITWATYPAESNPGSLTFSSGTSPFATDVNLQAWVLQATDSSGNPIANANVGFYVSGVDNFQSSGTTDITGHVTFDYYHANPGQYTIVAVDSVNNTVVRSTSISGTWTVPPSVSSSGGGQIAISVSTLTTIALPSTLPLSATITDSNGLTPTLAWSQVSGPGTVTFANSQQAATTASFSQDGVYVLQLYATDGATSASVQVTVTVNPQPVINYDQGWFGSPLFQSQVSGVVPITVESGITLTAGTLVYYPSTNQFDVTVLNSNTIGGGQIGTFDTTGIPNGSYVLELNATDSQGQSQYSDVVVNVVGNYKPGRVTSTVTDLIVPATGLAINIQRHYDSLNAGQSSDFGYGWSLGTTVNLTVDAHNDVTFTLGGQTHTFFFTPQPFGGSFFQLGTYSVAFTPDSGIHGTLTDNGQGCPLDFVLPSGSSWQCVGGGTYSPSGYIYTDPSGTQYAIAAGGSLQSITDIGGNALTVTPNGITSSTGLNVPFVRDASGRISKITDPKGNNYLYSYDSFGNLASVTYPGVSQPSTYTYDPNHLYLTGTDFRSNPLPTASYYQSTTNAIGQCQGDCDPNGLPLNGRLKSVQDAAGEITSYVYNLTTNTTTITYPKDANGNQGTAAMVYDNLGNLLQSTDPLGLTTTNVYDQYSNLLSVTDPLGHTSTYTYDALGNKTSSTYPQVTVGVNTTSTATYNQYSAPTSATDELGNARTFNYDANGYLAGVTDTVNGQSANVVSSLYSKNGLLQAVAVGADLAKTPTAASTFTYDAYGDVTSATNPLGKTTLYTYDALGRVLTLVRDAGSSSTSGAQSTPGIRARATRASSGLFASQSMSPAGALPNLGSGPSSGTMGCTTALLQAYSVVYTYTSVDGEAAQPSTVVDSLGRTLGATYDANGNIVAYTDPNGNTYQYTYDALNRLTNIALPTNPATGYSFTYDFRNNVIDAIDPEGHDRHNAYDLDGRLTSVTVGYSTPSATVTNFSYNADGTLQSATDALGHSTHYSYDAAGNLTQVVRGNVSVQYAYDGARNRISSTDGNGNKTTFQYDARQRLQQIGFSDLTQQTIHYDDANNVTGVIDQAGHMVDYGYDIANNLVSVMQANSPYTSANTTNYCLDGFGNSAWFADANGHTTSQMADALGRPTLLTYPDGTNGLSAAYDPNSNIISLSKISTAGSPTASFTYDSLSRLVTEAPDVSYSEPAINFTYTANGLLSKMIDGSGTTNYTYDSLDRITSKATPAGTLNYTYDAVGNVASMSSSPSGVSVNYSYDALNRLSTVVDNNLPAGQNTTTYTYDPASNLATATYPNGLQATYAYDQLNRLSQASTAIASYQYGRDANGNILTANESSNRNVGYSYDGIDELIGETVASDPLGANGSVIYSLDPVGNRLSDVSTLGPVASTSATYNADDQSQAETYDSSGDTTATGGKSYAYNSWLKLVSMNGGQVALAYNGLGQLVAKTAAGVATQYLIDDLSPTGYPQVVAELVGGQPVRTYTYGLERISELQTVSGTPTASFYQYDGRGTVRMLTSAAGAVTDTYEYDAFGNLIAHSGATPNAYLYRGERYDTDLGLYYLRARWYNPVTGRFMTRDPYQGSIYDPASLHRYNYARANPVNFIDPSGRASAVEYGVIALDIAAEKVAVAAFGYVVQCSIFAVASGVELVGETVGQDVLNLWTNFKTCSAKVTVKQLLTGAAIGYGIGVAGNALGAAAAALGEGLFGAEQGAGSALPSIYTSKLPVEGEFPNLAGINPGYEAGAQGTTTNCVSCTNAFMDRMAGNPDAVATPGPPLYPKDVNVWGFGPSMSASDAIATIESQPNGAYGAVQIQQAGVNHVIGYVNNNGIAAFIDPQSGSIVTLSNDTIVTLGTSTKLP
jgi:RHS repeat-associated protein